MLWKAEVNSRVLRSTDPLMYNSLYKYVSLCSLAQVEQQFA
jgi:hypothetical protein